MSVFDRNPVPPPKRQSASAAVTASQLAQKKYEAGKGTYVDYDEARNKQTNAAVDRITAYYEARYRQDVMDFYAGKMLK